MGPAAHEGRITPNSPWDVERFDVSADGRYMAYVVNEDGRSRLTCSTPYRSSSCRPRACPRGGSATCASTERQAARDLRGIGQSPPDVYVFDVEHSKLERWTQSETGPVDAKHLVAAELVRYPTWDRVNGKQRMLSAYVYRPRVRRRTRSSSTSTADRSPNRAPGGTRSRSTW